jgi:hypothetical protein
MKMLRKEKLLKWKNQYSLKIRSAAPPPEGEGEGG